MNVDTIDSEQAKKELKGILSKHKVIFTRLDHVSSSGMSRRISVYVCDHDEIINLDYWISHIDEKFYKRHKDGGLTVGGCGMDMGYHLVNNIMITLYGLKYNWNERFTHRWI